MAKASELIRFDIMLVRSINACGSTYSRIERRYVPIGSPGGIRKRTPLRVTRIIYCELPRSEQVAEGRVTGKLVRRWQRLCFTSLRYCADTRESKGATYHHEPGTIPKRTLCVCLEFIANCIGANPAARAYRLSSLYLSNAHGVRSNNPPPPPPTSW